MGFFSFKPKKRKEQQLYRIRVEPVKEGENVEETQEIVVKEKEENNN